MKPSLLIGTVATTVLLSSCCQTTLENRRDMYFPQPVNGPYTQMKHHGIPATEQVTTVTTVTTTGNAAGGK